MGTGYKDKGIKGIIVKILLATGKHLVSLCLLCTPTSAEQVNVTIIIKIS